MIIYNLLCVNQEESTACIVNAQIGHLVTYPGDVIILVPNEGFNILQFGPVMVDTGEVDEDGIKIFKEKPNTWQTLIVCESELTEDQGALLAPGTLKVFDQ